ncbi:FAD-dependent monooxygenase [Pontibacter sp. JAM-7]|uniref:FAD-dependent monooxygenase n=1 Tax=Pontibacter sp. JAM-7 TaxID=3366581 RepID=UPI003AF83461
MNEQVRFDVIIVGGGMVGATLACALGDTDLKVAVLEHRYPAPFSAEQPHDLRVSALSLASQNILQQLGVWQGVCQRRLCAYRRMKVWEKSTHLASTEFNADEINQSCLGHIVENRIIQLALLERLEQFDNISLICPTEVRQVDYAPASSLINLQDGRTLVTRLLVAADGGDSRVRQAAGIGVTKWDYDQHALVASVITDYPQQDITWQQFTPTGPLAFLPLSGPHASLVWYNTAEAVQQLKQLDSSALREAFMAQFPAELGAIREVLSVGSFPLRRQHAQSYVAEGLALVGDAAHMIHPLAGQGVNIGLLDAAALAEVILDAQLEQRDFSQLDVLRRYQKQRWAHNLMMMQTMDMFYRVFSNDNTALKLLRNIGLGLAERAGPIKQKVIELATGLQGGMLPALARGESLK